DTALRRGKMSLLAPWFAVRRRAALLLTNEAGDNGAALVRTALDNPALAPADVLVIMANLTALPMERRPNPAAGKDEWISMQPMTPVGAEPFTLATGRLFHDDLGVIALALARQQLLHSGAPKMARKAMIVSNPGGGLALLETFS